MYGYLAGFQVATGEFLFSYLCKMVWSLSGGLFLSCLIYFQNVSSISKNDNRVQCPGQRLTMLLNAMLPGSELESFANRTFTVQFGKDGELTVSAA